jgi:competence ComEA-like helix-hairpin-helix protein
VSQDAQPARRALPAALGDAQALAVALLLVVLTAGTLLSRLGREGPAFPIPPRSGADVSEGLPPAPEVPAAIPHRSKASPPSSLDLNRADAGALQTLPGVGPALAERILAYRREHGAFRSMEDLREVPGIGPKRWGRIREMVRIGDGA